MSLLKLIETDYFLCCFTLKTGSIVIGIYHILLGLLFTAVEFSAAVQRFHLDVKYLGESELHLVYSYSTASSVQLVFGLYLFWGTIKVNPSYILSGLILDATSFIMAFTMIAFPLTSWVFYGTIPKYRMFLAEELVSMVLSAYFMLIVYNWYRQLRSVNSNSEDLVNSRVLDVEVEHF